MRLFSPFVPLPHPCYPPFTLVIVFPTPAPILLTLSRSHSSHSILQSYMEDAAQHVGAAMAERILSGGPDLQQLEKGPEALPIPSDPVPCACGAPATKAPAGPTKAPAGPTEHGHHQHHLHAAAPGPDAGAGDSDVDETQPLEGVAAQEGLAAV